jgi:hypothetical protein
VRYVWDKGALGQFFHRLLWLYRASIALPMLRTQLHQMLLLPAGQIGEVSEASKSNAVSEIGERWIEKYCYY